jgi:hypothetical protein
MLILGSDEKESSVFQYDNVTIIGRVAEWFKAPVLKTGE